MNTCQMGAFTKSREWKNNVLTPSDVFVLQWRRMMIESHANFLQSLLVD